MHGVDGSSGRKVLCDMHGSTSVCVVDGGGFEAKWRVQHPVRVYSMVAWRGVAVLLLLHGLVVLDAFVCV